MRGTSPKSKVRIADIKAMVESNGQMIIQAHADIFHLSFGMDYIILHDNLSLSKISAEKVPVSSDNFCPHTSREMMAFLDFKDQDACPAPYMHLIWLLQTSSFSPS